MGLPAGLDADHCRDQSTARSHSSSPGYQMTIVLQQLGKISRWVPYIALALINHHEHQGAFLKTVFLQAFLPKTRADPKTSQQAIDQVSQAAANLSAQIGDPGHGPFDQGRGQGNGSVIIRVISMLPAAILQIRRRSLLNRNR